VNKGGDKMNETIKIWLEKLGSDPPEEKIKMEIEQVRGTISNEHLWELGYDGNEPNPHSENIKILMEYLDILEEMLKKKEKFKMGQNKNYVTIDQHRELISRCFEIQGLNTTTREILEDCGLHDYKMEEYDKTFIGKLNDEGKLSEFLNNNIIIYRIDIISKSTGEASEFVRYASIEDILSFIKKNVLMDADVEIEQYDIPTLLSCLDEIESRNCRMMFVKVEPLSDREKIAKRIGYFNDLVTFENFVEYFIQSDSIDFPVPRLEGLVKTLQDIIEQKNK
jgi:hypothetical protein